MPRSSCAGDSSVLRPSAITARGSGANTGSGGGDGGDGGGGGGEGSGTCFAVRKVSAVNPAMVFNCSRSHAYAHEQSRRLRDMLTYRHLGHCWQASKHSPANSSQVAPRGAPKPSGSTPWLPSMSKATRCCCGAEAGLGHLKEMLRGSADSVVDAHDEAALVEQALLLTLTKRKHAR
eukprot:scaffold17078_cov65-Phaeocystis_antarctica.AAC.7